MCLPSALLCLSQGKKCPQLTPPHAWRCHQSSEPVLPQLLPLFTVLLFVSEGNSVIHYLLEWQTKRRTEVSIFKIAPTTTKSLCVMTTVDICHILLCEFVYMCLCSFHCSSAVLFIRRAVSLSWQCLRGTSVGIVTMHGAELCGGGAQLMLVCSYAVIRRPVGLLSSWQTLTSQLRTHSS